jgi:DNA-binding NarL/FixJ family response regulator
VEIPGNKFKKIVAVCDTQPITTEGLKAMLRDCPEFRFLQAVHLPAAAMEMILHQQPDVLVLDKGFGVQAVLDWLAHLKSIPLAPAIIIWGVSMTEAEALRFLQAGARGIVRKTADLQTLLACLRTVAAGKSWMENSMFRESMRPERYPRSELTPREQQVMALVEQGFKNRQIAVELGIRPGTVKIHLKHIFEKTGVHGRYGLALTGLQDRGLVSLAS